MTVRLAALWASAASVLWPWGEIRRLHAEVAVRDLLLDDADVDLAEAHRHLACADCPNQVSA